MKTKPLLFTGLCLLLTGAALPAQAETLDDASIRKFYADSAALVQQPDKLKPFMEDHIDDEFTVQQNISQTINGGTPQTSTAVNDKQQVIASAVQMSQTIKIETLENKVVSIKYSDDHNVAYVTDTTAMAGTTSMAAGGIVHYKEGESCVDALTLRDGKLKLVKSACNDQVSVSK